MYSFILTVSYSIPMAPLIGQDRNTMSETEVQLQTPGRAQDIANLYGGKNWICYLIRIGSKQRRSASGELLRGSASRAPPAPASRPPPAPAVTGPSPASRFGGRRQGREGRRVGRGWGRQRPRPRASRRRRTLAATSLRHLRNRQLGCGRRTGMGPAAGDGGGDLGRCAVAVWEWRARWGAPREVGLERRPGLDRTRPGADSDSVTRSSRRVTGYAPSRASIPHPTALVKPRPKLFSSTV